MRKVKISIVCPVYQCGDCLNGLYKRLLFSIIALDTDYEIILVDDGSPDNSWDVISQLAKLDQNIKGIRLSRNFGQHYAITSGLNHCSGDWIIVMDCDLQDQPEEIPKLFSKAMEGYKIVFARRFNRKDRWLKRKLSAAFYFILSYLTNTIQDPSVANFGIYHQDVINAILSMNDYHRYFPTMIRWVGYKSTSLEVSHFSNHSRESSYNFSKRLKLALDVILSFSDKLLRLTIKFGFIISCIGILFGIYNIVLALNGVIIVPGYASLIISVWVLSGIIIMILGIVGLYIGKTFDKVKGRPTYIIENKINIHDESD